jgi:uncharacterized protein
MEDIHIPHLLKLQQQQQIISVDQSLADLETLTPVRGRMVVHHQGTFLEVNAQVETIITLSCDRCLQQYNQRLRVDQLEIIILDPKADQVVDYPLEQEVAWEELVETLSPQGYFSPDTWIYEQLCLSLPSKQLCSLDCPGILVDESVVENLPEDAPPIDHRWEALELLKKQLS